MSGQESLGEIDIASALSLDSNVAVHTQLQQGAGARSDPNAIDNLGHLSPLHASDTTDTSPGGTIVGGTGDLRYFGLSRVLTNQ